MNSLSLLLQLWGNKQIHKLMKPKFLLLLLSFVTILAQQPITASLRLVQYDPHVFQLTFSEEVSQPAFQLLLNSLYQLSYTFLAPQSPSRTFFFQAKPFQIPNGQKLEDYEIVFNSPMKVGEGRLSLGCFTLAASKVIVEIDYSQTLGLLAVLAAYIMINFTVLGLALIEFLQVYCLLMFRNEMKTMLYHEISRDLLLLNPVLTDGTYFSSQTLAAILLAPLIIVVVVGGIGFMVKRCARKTDSIIQKIIYQTLVYNLFISVSSTFLLPLFYNSIQFFSLCKAGEINPASAISKWGAVIAYLSIIATLAILYLFLYMINPKFSESESSWKKYLKSQQFLNFRKLHEVVLWEPWYKRNKNVMIIVKRLLVGGLFFWDGGFQVMVFLLQFLNLFYIFTVGPFKYEIYMNGSVITRLLMFLFYGFILTGNLYYSLSPITVNYHSVSSYLTVRDAAFLVIILLTFLFIFYEIYSKCSNLNYQIRLVREENEFRFKITEKERLEVEETSHRKHLKSFGESEDHSYQRNTRLTNFDTSDSTAKKAQDGSPNKRTSSKNRASRKFKEEEIKNSLPIHLDVEMEDRERAQSCVGSDGKKGKDRKARQKWKKESLLAEILKDN